MLLLLIKLVIQIPTAQNLLKQVVTSTLSEQLNNNVSIEKLYLKFPKKLAIQKLLITENNSDTLVYIEEFSLNLRILPLLKHQIVIQDIELINGQGDIGKLVETMDSEPTTEPTVEPTSPSWDISFNHFAAENCYFVYKDEFYYGFELILDIGQANFQMGYINLDSVILLENVEISKSFVSFEWLPEPENYVEDTTAFFDIIIENAYLTNSQFDYIDTLGGIIFTSEGEKVDANNILVDINESRVAFDEGTILNGRMGITFLPEEIDSLDTADYDYWRVEANSVTIHNLGCQMDYSDEPILKDQFDINHLKINEINGLVNNILFDDDILEFNTDNLTIKDENGPKKIQLETIFTQQDSVFSISKLNIKTSNGTYNLSLKTTVSITKHELNGKWFDLTINAEADNLYDLNKLYPISSTYLSDDFLKNRFQFKSIINGSTDKINVEQLYFHLIDSIELITDGTVIKPLNSELIKMQFNLHKLIASKNDLIKITDSLFSDSLYTLPDYFVLSGDYSGTSESYSFKGEAKSSVGNFTLNRINVNSGISPIYEVDLYANLHNLNSSTATEINDLVFALNCSYKGSNFAQSEGWLNLKIDSINYGGRTFTDIYTEAKFNTGDFTAQINSDNPDLLFKLSSTGEITPQQKKLNINLIADNFGMTATNYVPGANSINGELNAAITFKDENNFDLSIKINDVQFHVNDTLFDIPPSEFLIDNKIDKSSIQLNSKFNNFSFNIDESLTNIQAIFSELPGYYFDANITELADFILPSFSLKGEFQYQDAFIQMFSAYLPLFNKFKIDGNYNKIVDKGLLSLQITDLEYADSHIGNTAANIQINSKELKFNTLLDQVHNPLISGKIDFSGNLKNSTLTSTMDFSDNNSEKFISIETVLNKSDDKTTVHINPNLLIINYKKWIANPQNKVTISPSNITFNNFNASCGNEKIAIISENNGINTTINIKDFDVARIEKLIGKDTTATGLLSTNITIDKQHTQPIIKGELTVNNFNVYDIEMGTLSVPEFTYSNDEIAMSMMLKSKQLDIAGSGNYSSQNQKNSLAINMQINKLDIGELNYLLSDYAYDLAGTIKGDIKINGSLQSPLVNGMLNFTETGVGIKMLNNYFKFGNESISIKENTVHFDNLSIENQQNQTAKINGTIAVDSAMNVHPNLKIKTDDMVLMNSTKKDNSMVFGHLKAQADIVLTSKENKLHLTSDIFIDGTTDITYIIPEQLTLNNSRGTVKFIEFATDTIPNQSILDSISFQQKELFQNIHASVIMGDGTKIKMFFNETGKDFLEAKLYGTVKYFVDEDETEVSGRIDIESGDLHYSIPLVTVKDFKIEPGSYIKLSNNLYNPYLYLHTSSSIRASTEGLMPDYNKVLTFKVLLRMEGDMNDMKLKFDIATVTNDAIVSARLAQLSEKERNMNALNLLTRGSFLIFSKGNKVGSTTFADAQIDKFYANQLNQIISDNIHFVDLHFDVQSYEDINSYGSYVFHRNLYYNLGKSLFHDRAKINYKGSLNASSDFEAEQANSQFVQSELDLEIKITKDGSYRGIFFRKNKYEGLLEGEVVETGGGIRIRKRYDSLKEIFIPKKRVDQNNKTKN